MFLIDESDVLVQNLCSTPLPWAKFGRLDGNKKAPKERQAEHHAVGRAVKIYKC